MKILNKISVVILIGLLSVSCKDQSQPEVKTVDVEVTKKDVSQSLDPNATYAKVEFGIDGMTCAMGCAKTIEKKMAKMEGVKSAKVDFDKGLAMVEYDEAKVSPATLEKTVVSVADTYTVKDMTKVEDFGNAKKACKADCKMSCCADNVKKDKEPCAVDCKKDCCKGEKQAE